MFQILSKVERSKVLVIGGSDEMNLSLMKVFDQDEKSLLGQDKPLKVTHFDPALDVKP